MINAIELSRIIYHCAVRLDNFIVIVGGNERIGRFGTAVSTREIWRYNLYTDKWGKHVIPMQKEAPDLFHSAVAVAIEGTIYTFGGWSSRLSEQNELWTLSRTETGGFTWSFINHQCAKKSPSPRHGHMGWEYAGKLWVFGGISRPPPAAYLNDYGDRAAYWNNQLLCYDPNIQKWENPQCFGDVPSPRLKSSSTIIGERVWLFGGLDHNVRCLNDFFQLNMNSLTWTKIQTGQPSPEACCWCSCTLTPATDKQLVLHGVHTWIMDLTSRSWRRYASGKDHDRHDHTATSGLNSDVLVIGGYFKDTIMHEMADNIFHVMLEPKCLQKLAIHMIYKHQGNLSWKCLPKKLIDLLGIADKKQSSASSSSLDHDINQVNAHFVSCTFK